MNAIESQALCVIDQLSQLGEMAVAMGADALASATLSAILMVSESANEDGVKVDCEALGIGSL